MNDPEITLESFLRLNQLAKHAKPIREMARRANAEGRPAEIGLRVEGTLKSPRYLVTDHARALSASIQAIGVRVVTPATLRRLHEIAAHTLREGSAPAGLDPGQRAAWLAALRSDVEILSELVPSPPSPPTDAAAQPPHRS